MRNQEGVKCEIAQLWIDDVPPARFRLSLIGRFELTGPDGAIDLPSKKLAGLLAYLACSAPVPQPREKLATLLWGSHFEGQARQNLRQALFRLRRMLGPDTLIADGEEISLAPGAMDSDAARLETLVREGSLGSLAAAVNLYKDRLLADLSVAEEAWDDWLEGERRRLEALALDAMVRLADLELQSRGRNGPRPLCCYGGARRWLSAARSASARRWAAI
jgi:DNA-binding SARP family transcriptional activator